MIKNYTSHEIVIFRKEDTFSDGRKLYKKENAKPVCVLPLEGTLDAKIKYESDREVAGVTLFSPKVENIDPLPKGDDYLVVSALFVNACKLLGRPVDRLLTVSQPVYDSPDNPRPIGCIGFNLAE